MKNNTENFKLSLSIHKKSIDDDITLFASEYLQKTKQVYGVKASVPVEAYLHVLQRGGKRLRGALTMFGYEMCGGTDKTMIIQAARAVEMIHAYLLIMDDIQDRSLLRRGEKTAHIALAAHHAAQKYRGEPDHFGVALALNAMGVGNHQAHIVLSNLAVPEELRLSALRLLDETVILTAHGQTLDICNEMSGDVTIEDVKKVMEYKTAYYTILNPLQIGMTLAGATPGQLEAIKAFTLCVGRAFQIKDDIVGIYGSEQELGKSPQDDIREGKQTLLTVHARTHAPREQREYLKKCLGNKKLTDSQFEKCKDIIIQSGSLVFAEKLLHSELESARGCLDSFKEKFKDADLAFLAGLVDTLEIEH